MSDSVTNVTTTGWGGNIKKALTGAVVGLFLFVVSFPLLWWNEGNAVQTAQSLAEGKGLVVTVPAEKVDPQYDGKLVHLSGLATTEETLQDDKFGMSANAIALIRDVEMYQWDEEEHTKTEKQTGGSSKETTTYTYDKVWADYPIDSSDFYSPAGHMNPREFPHESRTLTASKVTLGAFTLNPSQISEITSFEPLPATEETLARLPEEMRTSIFLEQDAYYLPVSAVVEVEPAAEGDLAAEDLPDAESEVEDTASEPVVPAPAQPADEPQIGDVRIRFSIVKPAEISIVAKQVSNTFEPYLAKAGKNLDMVGMGVLSAENMFDKAIADNNRMTWILRAVGFGCMFFGVTLIGGPLGAVGDFIPMVGSLFRGGVFLLALAVSLPLSLGVIAVAWLFYRPVLAIALIILAVAVIVGIVFLVRKMFGEKKSEHAVT